MRRRFSGRNEVAGEFLGDLNSWEIQGVDRFLERPGPTSVARDDHLRDGQILRWAPRAVKYVSEVNKTLVDQLAIST